MEPLTPNDPLWKLLGEARPVKPRGNFTQNVMREVRGLPQETGWLARLRGSFSDWLSLPHRPVWACTAVAAIALLIGTIAINLPTTPSATSTVATTASVPATMLDDADMALIADDIDLPLEGLNHMDALVAMDDTSALTDTEIAFLLY